MQNKLCIIAAAVPFVPSGRWHTASVREA